MTIDRFSVSALRDYHACPKRFYFKRVMKLPEPTTPNMVYGSIVHAAFYTAYAVPKANGQWEVTGEFDPAWALTVYDRLTSRNDGDTPADNVDEVLFSQLPTLTNLNIGKGRTKAMAGREGWTAHFRNMLSNALNAPLPNPIAIEQRVEYRMGGTAMLGFIDMILLDEEVGKVLVDLKTGYNAPTEAELRLNDQVARYYKAIPDANEFWLYHMRSGKLYAVERNEKLISFLSKEDSRIATLVNSEADVDTKFPRRFGEQCAYCPFSNRCLL